MSRPQTSWTAKAIAKKEYIRELRNDRKRQLDLEKIKKISSAIDCCNCTFKSNCFEKTPYFGEYFICDGFQFEKK